MKEQSSNVGTGTIAAMEDRRTIRQMMGFMVVNQSEKSFSSTRSAEIENRKVVRSMAHF
jgi:thermostable 8-oxoguanine DNA glycosylase